MSGVWKTKHYYAKMAEFDRSWNIEMDQEEWKKNRKLYGSQIWQRETEDSRARAYLRAVHDAEALLIRQRVADGDFEDMPELEEIYSKIKNRRGNGGNISEWYLVTVNPAPGHTVEDLTHRVHKYLRRKIIKEAYYAFEQRGVDDGTKGDGVHVHLLVRQRGDVFHGDFQRNTRNTFRPLVGNEKAVDVRTLKTPVDVEKAKKYVLGCKKQKDGERKDEKCVMDVTWRLENNIEPYYHYTGSGNAVPEETTSSDPTSEICAQIEAWNNEDETDEDD
jgi:hypothetical protein